MSYLKRERGRAEGVCVCVGGGGGGRDGVGGEVAAVFNWGGGGKIESVLFIETS